MSRFVCVLILAAAFVVGCAAAQPADVQRGRELQRSSIEAYKRGNFAEFLDLTREALEMRPGHPALVYNVAAGNALVGNADAAVEWLNLYARMGQLASPDSDSDFAGVADHPDFAHVIDRIHQNNRMVEAGDVAFRISDSLFVPEGLAYDVGSGSFFVASLHRRQVVRIDDGDIHVVASMDADPVLRPLGVAVDAKYLWITVSSVGDVGDPSAPAELRQYERAGGRLLATYRTEKPGFFGDVVIDPYDGSVLVSKPLSGEILRLRPDSGRLDTFVPPGALSSPQGVAFCPESDHIYIADYAQGLFRYDRQTHAMHRLDAPEDAMLLGIDGLACSGRYLIGVQSGSRPQRVVGLRLATDGLRIERLHVIEANIPAMDEPTVGVIAAETFYYVANGQWAKWAQLPASRSELRPPVIRRIDLRALLPAD